MPKDGLSEEVEKEVGQAEGKMFTHRSAFSRASVIQAFLGSAPQLTLQLYITVLQQSITTGRGMYARFLKNLCLPWRFKLRSKTIFIQVKSIYVFICSESMFCLLT